MSVSITIVTPCYNTTPFLERIYTSLVNQTYRRFEWICIDDRSKDDTIARLLALESPGELGMRVYELPQNTGGPLALAIGTQLASAEAVIWLDHDDELFPDALEQVRRHWPEVNKDAGESGLFLRATNPTSGEMIGRKLGTGRRLTWSEMSNRYPEITDGTFVFRADLLRRFATVETMEPLLLNGIIYNELTSRHPFVAVDISARYYHRDNPDSQTRVERVSRKSVVTYARLLDGADRFFLLSPSRWIRHIVTMFRYAKLVHGRRREALNHVRRPSMRWLARAIWPVSLGVNYRNANEVLIELPRFDGTMAEGLVDLRAGDK